jgi:hypothetical protein
MIDAKQIQRPRSRTQLIYARRFVLTSAHSRDPRLGQAEVWRTMDGFTEAVNLIFG